MYPNQANQDKIPDAILHHSDGMIHVDIRIQITIESVLHQTSTMQFFPLFYVCIHVCTYMKGSGKRCALRGKMKNGEKRD